MSVTIKVNPACGLLLDASLKNFTETGGTGTVKATAIGACNWSATTTNPWITITGVNTDTISFKVSPLTIEAQRTGTITIGGLPLTIFQKKTVAAVSAATFIGGDIASEQAVSAFGAGVADTTASAASIPLPTQLGGVEVRVRDSANMEKLASLFYVSPTQINYKIPAGMALGNSTVAFYKDGQIVSTATVKIAKLAAGIYTANQNGSGVAAATVQPSSLTTQRFMRTHMSMMLSKSDSSHAPLVWVMAQI